MSAKCSAVTLSIDRGIGTKSYIRGSFCFANAVALVQKVYARALVHPTTPCVEHLRSARMSPRRCR